MLADIKKILGYKNNQFDSIIKVYIDAAKYDLASSGISKDKISEQDPLIYSAIVSYVLSRIDTYEYRELSSNTYMLEKDQLRHNSEYID